jgi:hypothetical protein
MKREAPLRTVPGGWRDFIFESQLDGFLRVEEAYVWGGPDH